MTRLITDFRKEEAEKLIDSWIKLPSAELTEEQDLILYLLGCKDEYLVELQDELSKYRKFFDMMDRLLPNRNPIIG